MVNSVSSITPHDAGFIVSESDGYASRDAVTITSGAGALAAGHVLESFAVSASASAAAGGANSGNGAVSNLSGGSAPAGLYRLTMLTSTTYRVRSLGTGGTVGSGTVASNFSAGPNFVLSAGSAAFAAGDTFTITVNSGGYEFREYDPANSDAVIAPAGILIGHVDATSNAVKAAVLTRAAEVNRGELSWFSGATAGEIETALESLAQDQQVVARDAI